MKHYCTQFIKSQMFHCRIFIILPPAYVFDIRCSMGSHPTNCHRIWEAFRCTWTLKTDWISDLYQSWLCVWAQYKFCIINCALLYGSMQNIFSAQAHCIMYIIVYLAHIAYMVSVAVIPLHATWCHSQYNCALLYGSRRTQMLHISQKPTANSTKLDTVVQVPCTKAALCFV